MSGTPTMRTDGPGRAYFPALDTMRAVGALAVLTTHVAFWSGDYLRHGAWGTLLARMDVGVAIFFVLSGFLLSRPWLIRAAERRPAPSTVDYFWHRFLRIVPLYVVTVAIAYVFIVDNRAATWSERLTSLAMLDTIVGHGFPAGLTHMWSLAVEVEFYLLLPVVMWLAVGRLGRLDTRRIWGLVGLMALTSIAWFVAISTIPALEEWRQLLPAYLTWFAIGIALAHLDVLRSTRRPVGRAGSAVIRLAQQPGSCWAAAAGLMLVAATPVAGPSMLMLPTASESAAKHLIYAAVAGLVVLPAVFGPPDGLFMRVFTQPALRHLGLISYGIFCLHLPMLHLVMWLTGYPLFQGHGLQIWTLTVAFSLVAAELAYRLVERPVQRLRRRRRGAANPLAQPASESPSPKPA